MTTPPMVLDALSQAGLQVYCLGTTKEGHPRHPLYAKGNTGLTPFTGPYRL